MKKIIMVSAMIAALVGCSTSSTGTCEHYSQEDIHSIQKGVTTESAVLKMLGTPTSQTTDSLGNKKYKWTRKCNSGANEDWVKTKSVDVTINKKGVVDSYSSSSRY